MKKLFSENTNINMRHLRCLIQVARTNSFSAAADNLGVAVSALSETIKQVEQETGIQLFDRTSRPIKTTELGQLFVEQAEIMVENFDNMIREMRSYGGLEKGRLRISAASSMIAKIVIPALEVFKKNHPDIEISIQKANTKIIHKALIAGTADIGVGERMAGYDALNYHYLMSDPFGLACCTETPLAQGDKVVLAQLEGKTMIGLSPDAGIRLALENKSLLTPGLAKVDIETPDIHACMTMVGRNLGIAIAPYFAVQDYASNNVSFVPIKDLSLKRDLYLLSKTRQTLSPAGARFLQICRELASNLTMTD